MARRIAAAIVVVGAVLGLQVAPSSATFTAQTGTAQLTVTTTWVGAPTLGTASVSGLTATMTGSPGTNATGWQVAGIATTAADCTAVNYSSYTAASTSSYSQTFATADNGKLACFQAQSTLAGWTNATGSPTTSTRIGLVAKSVSYAAATSGCTVAATCGATITITFNQPLDPATVSALATEPVCYVKNGANSGIVIADGTSGTGCSKGDIADVGLITGVTPGSTSRATATYTLSNSNQTLTVRVTTLTGAPSVSGWPGTFNPSGTTLKSATGAVPLCSSTSAPDCTLSASSG